MAIRPCYFLSPPDLGLAYGVDNRLFNFQVEQHGDHVHIDLSIHVVQPDVNLGGGRGPLTIRLRDFGAC